MLTGCPNISKALIAIMSCRLTSSRDNGAALAPLSIAVIAWVAVPTILKDLRRKGIYSVLQLVLV